MVRNPSRPCRKYSAFLASRIILLSSHSYIYSWTHCTGSLSLLNRRVPCSQLLPSSLFHPNGTKGPCRPLVCVYRSIELCIGKQESKNSKQSPKRVWSSVLKSYTHQHWVKFLSSTVIITNEGNTWRPNSRETFRRVMSGKLSMSVAILNASWASLKMCDEEWIFFWIDSNTVSSLRTSPARCKQNHQNRTSSQNIQRCIIVEPAIAMQ